MKLLLYIVIGFMILMVPALVWAADLTFDADSYLELTNPSMTLTIVSGSALDAITTNTGSIEFTMSGGQSVTIQSPNGYDLHNNTLGILNSCSASNRNITEITFSLASGAAQQTITLTPNTNVVCTASTPGGGTGDGGGGAPSSTADKTPPNEPINIKLVDPRTGSSLELSWTKPTDTDFSYVRIYRSTIKGVLGTLIPDAQTGTNYTDSGLVENQVYYYTLRSVDKSGNESKNTNQFKGTPTKLTASVTKEISGSSGGTVELTDKSAQITIPAGAISGQANTSINPTTDYQVVETGWGVVGNQAFEIEVKSGENVIKNFNKSLTFTFSYTAEQIADLDESTLKIQYYNETEKKWITLISTLDKTNKKISATLNHLTLFIITGEKLSKAKPGDLIKKTDSKAVYYLGSDNKRYVFPKDNVYFTWYEDFSDVIAVSESEFKKYQLGGNIKIRPGTKLIQFVTNDMPFKVDDPNVYAVEPGGVLRHITNAEVARALYGENWEMKIAPQVNYLFPNYTQGTPLSSASYPTGSLVKSADSSTIYYIENGKKRMFGDYSIFTNNGFRDEFVITIDSKNLANYPTAVSNISTLEDKLKTTTGPSL